MPAPRWGQERGTWRGPARCQGPRVGTPDLPWAAGEDEGPAGRGMTLQVPPELPKGLVGASCRQRVELGHGWAGDRQQQEQDEPALTLNTSISSSISSSVSMSSRGSTMTFCTVPRSARHQGAWMLSATGRAPAPSPPRRGSLMGPGTWGRTPPPSPSTSSSASCCCYGCSVPLVSLFPARCCHHSGQGDSRWGWALGRGKDQDRARLH